MIMNLVSRRHFTGSIVITDPCYIIPSSEWNPDKIDLSNGNGLEQLGFTKFLWEETGIGDWNCDLLSLGKDGLTPIGAFSADSGLVGVFLLDEIPDIENIKKYADSGLATIIEGYKGFVSVCDSDEDPIRKIIGVGHAKGKQMKFTTQVHSIYM